MASSESRLLAQATAWCDDVAARTGGSVNQRPHVRVLHARGDVVRAELGFQLWNYVQSGSGSGEYYVRIVDVIRDETTIRGELCHPVTEWEDDHGDPHAALDEFRAAIEAKHPLP